MQVSASTQMSRTMQGDVDGHRQRVETAKTGGDDGMSRVGATA
jgi:hypothetical protein